VERENWVVSRDTGSPPVRANTSRSTAACASPARWGKSPCRAGQTTVELRDPGPDKGRPSPGGEEARVVVYQPRGVGLMHTQPEPSGANYTHESSPQRKSRRPSSTTLFL
jgi:hypothetical protein